MINFGIYQGLNVKLPYQDEMQQKMQFMAMERQAKNDAETKAKLLYDDMEFGKATSDYGQEQLNNFYSQRIKEIGKFVTDNPDITLSPAKMMQLKNMKRQLVDNPILLKEMRFAKERDALQDFIKKNPGVEHEPEIQEMLAKVKNYNMTGRADQADPNSEFVFLNPDMKVDLPNAIMSAFKNVKKNGIEPIAGTKEAGYYSFADDNDVYAAAQTLLTDPKVKRLLTKQMEALPDDQKAKYGGDVAKYAADLGKPYVPGKEFVPPKYDTSGDGSGRGSKASEKDQSLRGGWQDLLEDARNNPDMPVPGVREAVTKVLGSPNGPINLSMGAIVSTRGNFETGLMDDRVRDYLTKANAQPTGEIVYRSKNPNNPGLPGGYFANYNVRIPIQDFDQFFDSKAIDWSGYGGNIGSVSSDDEFTIHNGDGWDEDYTHLYKPYRDEKGNMFVEMTVTAPLTNAQTASFAKAYNAATGFGTGDGNPERPAGIQYQPVLGPDGKIYMMQKNETVNP